MLKQGSKPALRVVKLPFPGKRMVQDTRAQSVTAAADILQAYVWQKYNSQQTESVAEGEKPRVLELGCGCGIISIMLALHFQEWSITGIDIQEDLILLARQNAMDCNLCLRFLCQDLRTYTSVDKYDLIVSNPPWQKIGTGRESPYLSRNLSRIEIAATAEDIVLCIGRNLTDRGSAYLIYPYSRIEDIRNQVLRTSLDINPVSGLNEFSLDSRPDLRLTTRYQIVHIHKKLRN